MPSRILIAALTAAALPATAAAVSLYDRVTDHASLATSRPAGAVAGTGSSARVYLTGEQVRQTRDTALWPAELRSLLNVDHALRYGEWLWNDRGVPAGRSTIRIDLGRQLLSVERGGHEIGTAVILYGAESHQTPVGRFPILSKAADYRSRTYDAPMPYALRLTADGVAIHGSDVRWGSATHGCIGLPLAFARKLFAEIEKGDNVLIFRSSSGKSS